MLDGHAIAISPADPDKVILAVRMGLFETEDGGQTWQDMEVGRFSPTTYGRDIKVSPQDGNTMYAALSVAAASKDGAVYRSTDKGASWKRFDKVQVHGTIMSIALHHTDPDQVYIGARYDGEILWHRGRRRDVECAAVAIGREGYLFRRCRIIWTAGRDRPVRLTTCRPLPRDGIAAVTGCAASMPIQLRRSMRPTGKPSSAVTRIAKSYRSMSRAISTSCQCKWGRVGSWKRTISPPARIT